MIYYGAAGGYSCTLAGQSLGKVAVPDFVAAKASRFSVALISQGLARQRNSLLRRNGARNTCLRTIQLCRTSPNPGRLVLGSLRLEGRQVPPGGRHRSAAGSPLCA